MSYPRFKHGQWVHLYPEETQCWTEEFQNKLGTPLRVNSVAYDGTSYIYMVETADGLEVNCELYDEELEALTAVEIAQLKVKGVIE